ncbi:MAG TPA: hypothetical protein VM140_10565 [Burkholderiales bacterium]|nr:hypothetical protein [Burkholderiales bacterium]
MKRPPDRKAVLALAILVMAASAMLSRPAAGLADHGMGEMFLKKTVASGGR